MSRPLVTAYHLVWVAYGWWLPNDPRGSMSRAIRNDLIAELGRLHYGRKRLQPASRDIRTFYNEASTLLKHPLLPFDGAAVEQVARAFAGRDRPGALHLCYACAIMPDHVHVLIRKHKHLAEEMIANLQRESHLRLREAGSRDMDRPVWGGPGWKVFLDHPDDIRRTIPYVNDNPPKMRLPRQAWPFVREYDGWPLHPGHSPHSPYARRLRGEG